MQILRQCVIIFLCLGVGEIIVALTETQFPSALIGMLLLTFLLKKGWVKLEWVQDVSNVLLSHFGLFFVPPGVALMLYFDLIAAEWFSITVATVASILIVLALTGWTYQLLRRRS